MPLLACGPRGVLLLKARCVCGGLCLSPSLAPRPPLVMVLCDFPELEASQPSWGHFCLRSRVAVFQESVSTGVLIFFLITEVQRDQGASPVTDAPLEHHYGTLK